MTRPVISPEDCPEPYNHEVFRYCPICTWTETESEPVKSFIQALRADVVLPVNAETIYQLRQYIVRLETAAREVMDVATRLGSTEAEDFTALEKAFGKLLAVLDA